MKYTTMNETLTELNELEKEFKKLYHTEEGKAILSKPMRYPEYQQFAKGHPSWINLEEFYAERTRESLGSTIVDVGEIDDGDGIAVQRHGRYGYPIMHNHAYIEMVYVYRGRCTHYVDEQSFEMVEGDLCILAPNAMHVVVAVADEDVILNILVSKEVLDQSFLKMVKEKRLLADFFENVLYGKTVSPYIIFPTGKDLWMHELLLAMYKEANEKKYAYRECLELYVRQMFIHVIRKYEMLAKVATPQETQVQDNIVAILGYLAVNYNQVTLKKLADFFCYSESYMSRILKKFTGKTFGTIVTELQMKRAAELLTQTDQALNDIAQEVGCFDYSHFSRKFKKTYGASPDTYRKKRTKIYTNKDE